MKKKILYFMHVDWHWIKQRPHFIAEGLSASFDLLVVHSSSNRKSNLVKNKSTISRVPILSLPLARFKAISHINKCIRSLYFLWFIVFYKPAVVWVTFPTLIPEIGFRLLKNKMILYDCMDDAQEFCLNEEKRQHIIRKEKALLEVADQVLVSSNNLYNKIIERGAAASKVTLVRNAFGGEICADTITATDSDKPKDMFHILYVGTISNYLEFDVLLHCVNKLDNVEFHFFGPVSIAVPKHKRLKFYGVIEHANLASRAKQFDCFIMPFMINELIKGVDPVKLYEYINFNKNIICPYYAEVDRFSEFVNFYSNKDEFVGVVKGLISNNSLKYSAKQRREFLENNSWEVRTEKVTDLINNTIMRD